MEGDETIKREPDEVIGSQPESRVSFIEPESRASVMEPESRASGMEPESRASGMEPESRASGMEPESRASGMEPEFVFTNTLSVTSSEDSDTIDRTQTDSSVEYLMTAQEIQELDKRLEDVIDNLQKQREDYEKWENGLSKRRLEAYGRLKALGKFHLQRMQVYDTVKDYLQTVSSGSKNRTK